MSEKWLTPCKTRIVLGGGNYEIMTFRYLKTLAFENFLPHFLMIFLLGVLLVTTISPSLLLFDFPHIHLSLHSFQENWYECIKFWRLHRFLPYFSGGMMPLFGLRNAGYLSKTNYWQNFRNFQFQIYGSFIQLLFFIIFFYHYSHLSWSYKSITSRGVMLTITWIGTWGKSKWQFTQ